MKLLIYLWSAYLERDVLNIVEEKRITYNTFSWKFTDKNDDEKFVSWFRKEIPIRDYDALLSINYWPLLSEVCQEQGVKYLAWCYDNPLNVVRIEETLGNPVNYVFLFDRIQYLKYKTAGFDTVYHLPLGVNRSRMETLTISSAERRKYTAEVALVGKLYESQLPEIMAPLNDYTKGFMEALMKIQSGITGSYLLDDCISESLIQDINRQYLEKEPNTQVRMSKEALSYAMASEVTRRDRIVLLSLCGARFDTRLYSYQNSEIIKNVKKYPAVDYYTEMPKIFACSQINLNPSLRIIQTGIPLRAFDIMGAGGFLLSNYQEELLELFENEKEMVVYESLEDAVDKADFYLRHEEIRKKITLNGKKKTLEQHSLQDRLEKMLAMQ
ncbi:MAG: DUF3880 domain-containing protein [Lachnospiraceae bacterium]|nr:DUF3880 domain-containing protein [Lachnospiraceae bacterium]